MELFTKEQRAQMLENGSAHELAEGETDGDSTKPVIKLFTPDGACTWLLSELAPDDPNIAYGLCDLGVGFPELGSVCISELRELRGALGLPVERDLYFTPNKSLNDYAEEAYKNERITT